MNKHKWLRLSIGRCFRFPNKQEDPRVVNPFKINYSRFGGVGAVEIDLQENSPENKFSEI